MGGAVPEHRDASTRAKESETASKPGAPSAETKNEERRVQVDIAGKSGSELRGTATLVEVEGGVRIRAEIQSAPPGEHGFHIHQSADCSAADAKSAGGHFAPRGHQHGLPSDDERHLGDLGNIRVAEDGTGSKTIVVDEANLQRGHERSFLERALMVHAKPDDGGQPTGNAGARIGCGPITASKG